MASETPSLKVIVPKEMALQSLSLTYEYPASGLMNIQIDVAACQKRRHVSDDDSDDDDLYVRPNRKEDKLEGPANKGSPTKVAAVPLSGVVPGATKVNDDVGAVKRTRRD